MKPLILTTLFLLILTSNSISAKQPEDFSAALTQLHNQARAKTNYCGWRKTRKASPLKENKTLSKAAKTQVLKMLKARKLSHSIDGNIKDRIKRTGYRAKAMSENLAFGTNTARATFKLWMKSKNHCKNLLSNKYSEIGLYHKGGYTAAIYASPRQ